MKNSLKKGIIFVITFVFISLISASCKKEFTKSTKSLPLATTIGANTFGAYIDGKLWVTRTDHTPGESNLCVSYTNNSLDIAVYCDSDADFNRSQNFFKLHRDGITGVGTYDLSNPANTSVITVADGLDLLSDYYNVISGTLTITKLDVANKIVSGHLDCVVENFTGDLTHEVENVVFDLKIGYCQ